MRSRGGFFAAFEAPGPEDGVGPKVDVAPLQPAHPVLVFGGQGQKLARLDGNERRVLYGELGVKVDQRHQSFTRIARRAGAVLGVGQQPLADVDQQFPEEALFALEVAINGRPRNTDCAADLVEGDDAVPALGEQRRRRGQKFLSCRSRAVSPWSRLAAPGPAGDARRLPSSEVTTGS